jgi:hypothetical protein
VVAKGWLLSFLVGTLQDPLLNSPLQIFFFHVILPLYIRHKIRANLDGTGSQPYHFRAFAPTGPACRWGGS